MCTSICCERQCDQTGDKISLLLYISPVVSLSRLRLWAKRTRERQCDKMHDIAIVRQNAPQCDKTGEIATVKLCRTVARFVAILSLSRPFYHTLVRLVALSWAR